MSCTGISRVQHPPPACFMAKAKANSSFNNPTGRTQKEVSNKPQMAKSIRWTSIGWHQDEDGDPRRLPKTFDLHSPKASRGGMSTVFSSPDSMPSTALCTKGAKPPPPTTSLTSPCCHHMCGESYHDVRVKTSRDFSTDNSGV